MHRRERKPAISASRATTFTVAARIRARARALRTHATPLLGQRSANSRRISSRMHGTDPVARCGAECIDTRLESYWILNEGPSRQMGSICICNTVAPVQRRVSLAVSRSGGIRDSQVNGTRARAQRPEK